jgi:hypothetical protein
MIICCRRKSTIHHPSPGDSKLGHESLAAVYETSPIMGEQSTPASMKSGKDKDAHSSHAHTHRKNSKDGVEGNPVTSAVAQATAAAAQVAATQASSAAAAAAVLQSSIKQIEGKLEKIEKVMLALEKNAAPAPVAAPPTGRWLTHFNGRKA